MSADKRLDYTFWRYGDVMVDTVGMSSFEKGAYLNILDRMGAHDGYLPADSDALHRLLGSDCPTAVELADTVLRMDRLFYRQGDRIMSYRVDAQHKESRKNQAKRRGGVIRAEQAEKDGRGPGGTFNNAPTASAMSEENSQQALTGRTDEVLE